MFNPWGQVWWEIYLSTFIFIVLSLIIGFMALCIIALLMDKPSASKHKGQRKTTNNIISQKVDKNGL